MILPITELDGTEFPAMFSCFSPEVVDTIEITENGHYGWPSDKDPSEWTEEEWLMGPIGGVDVNVQTEPPAPVEHVVKTVVGTPTQIQIDGELTETYYCIEYDELKELMDSADELIFKLFDSQYTRPLMGFVTMGSLTHFEIIELLRSTYDAADRTVGTKSICVIKDGSLRLTDEERRYINSNIVSKIPYNIYNTYT